MRLELHRFLDEERGSSVTEFALLIPVFALILLGTIQMMFMVYSSSTLHYAAEQAARCAVVSKSYATAPVGDPSLGCQTKSSTSSYATSIYSGPHLTSLAFTATENATCGGRKVVGAGTYGFRTGLVNIDVPVSATACFPTFIDPALPWT